MYFLSRDAHMHTDRLTTAADSGVGVGVGVAHDITYIIHQVYHSCWYPMRHPPGEQTAYLWPSSTSHRRPDIRENRVPLAVVGGPRRSPIDARSPLHLSS